MLLFNFKFLYRVIIIRLTRINARLYFDAKCGTKKLVSLVERNDEKKDGRKHIEPDSLRIKLFASGSRVIDNSKLFSVPFLSVESKNRTLVDPK